MPATPVKKIDPGTLNLKEHVISINRVTKVVKGGKNLSFAALVVVGDPQSRVVGFGTGKAREVPSAIKKGIEAAKRNLRKVNIHEHTIMHTVLGRFGSGICGPRYSLFHGVGGEKGGCGWIKPVHKKNGFDASRPCKKSMLRSATHVVGCNRPGSCDICGI